MSDLNLAYAAVGFLVLSLALFFRVIRGRYILSDPIIALLFGMVIGPMGLGLLDIEEWSESSFEMLREIARLTLGIGVMGVALRVPRAYVIDHWKTMAIVLGLLMPAMWVVSSLLTHWLLSVPLVTSFIIGAAVTPTDPVVASSIVVGPEARKNLPAHLRHVISAESGANDGLGYPFLVLPMLLLAKPTGEAIGHWLLASVLQGVVAGTLIGVFVGYAAGRMLEWREWRKAAGETSSFLSYSLALTLLILGLTKIAGGDSILAVFAGGLVYDNVIKRKERTQEEHIQEALSQFFTLPAFMLIGLSVPWRDWLALGWKGLGLAAAILLLRRLPAMLLLGPALMKVSDKQYAYWRDVLFSGWFGPVGIAALYYACEATIRLGSRDIWPVVSLVICTSILAHGMSANGLIRWYGKSGGRQDAQRQEGIA